MMRAWLIMTMLLTITACEKPSRVEQLPAYEQDTVVDCHYYGFCYNCVEAIAQLGECGFTVARCSGEQKARVRIMPYVEHYKDHNELKEDSVVVKEYEKCH